MIRITSMTGTNQYDSEGRAITTWDPKKCAWIVNPEFENERIDWYGEDSDFSAGYTLAEYIAQYPNWDKLPDINVTWYWNTKETCIKAFGTGPSFGKGVGYWDEMSYPYMGVRSWGYINEPKETAVERFINYAEFARFADRVVVTYNNEILFDGSPKSILNKLDHGSKRLQENT